LANNEAEIIGLCVPQMPDADALLPYLREIDTARWYSNYGPLLYRFEERIAKHFGVATSAVASLSSGTAALTLALRESGARPGTLCVMPAWTFGATAHAVFAAGLTPYFVDVDDCDWALAPDQAREALRAAPGTVSAVLPVAPFGAPIDYSGWDRLAEETGIAVVIDGAAAFDSARPGNAPVMISLHATKALGVGEGGLIISRQRDIVAGVWRLSNFGFAPTREMLTPAFNAKLSEYHAAVGLAALDTWLDIRSDFARLTDSYLSELSAISGVTPMPGFGAGWVSNTCTVKFDAPIAAAIAEKLAHAGIETRQWWGLGCHRQPAFADCPRGSLEVTDSLAARTLALPFHLELGTAELSRIAGALAESLDALTRRGRAI